MIPSSMISAIVAICFVVFIGVGDAPYAPFHYAAMLSDFRSKRERFDNETLPLTLHAGGGQVFFSQLRPYFCVRDALDIVDIHVVFRDLNATGFLVISEVTLVQIAIREVKIGRA